MSLLNKTSNYYRYNLLENSQKYPRISTRDILIAVLQRKNLEIWKILQCQNFDDPPSVRVLRCTTTNPDSCTRIGRIA